jgi:hypothetical protein
MPASAVGALRLAGNRAAADHVRDVERRAAAAQDACSTLEAALSRLGRIDAFEANADAADLDRVAVDDAGGADDGRGDRGRGAERTAAIGKLHPARHGQGHHDQEGDPYVDAIDPPDVPA